jgi:GNAT superfamily N-acetyltransferase
MKSKHIPMSVEEFRLMEHPFGWKAEYFSGEGHLTPREHLVRNQLILTPPAIAESRQTGNPSMTATQAAGLARIVPVDPSLKEQMIATFFEAFEDSVEFCDWSVDEIRTHAAKNINNYFQGVRGQPHPASRMALEPHRDPLSEGLRQRLIGLALVLENKAESFRSGLPTMETTQAQQQIELDLLLVQPSHQRMGIATQMVASAINSLYADGIEDLRSGYHICNDGSRAWHQQLGFKEIPDYFYCRLKAAWYRDEIWRCEQLETSEPLEELRTERDRWERLVQELEPWKES